MTLLLMVCLFLGKMVLAKAQITPGHRTFEKARELANAGQYDSAEILQDSLPQNNDYKIHQARIFGSKKDFPQAIDILKPLNDAVDFFQEVIQIIVTPRLWEGHFEEVIGDANDSYRFTSQIIPFYRYR